MIKRFTSHISAFFIWLISYTPFFILYGISNLLSFVVFRVVGYRKKVIDNNIRKCFPTKTDAEVKQIKKGFYRNFSDVIVESIKCFSISGKELKKRTVYINTEVFKHYFDKKQSIIAVLPHYTNWEWVGIVSGQLGMPEFHALYKPLKDPVMDNMVLKSRERFGLNLIPAKQARTIIPAAIKDNEWNCFGFIADQTPRPTSAHWIDLLNQKTAFFKGTALFAIEYNLPIVYARINRVKRGYYEVKMIPLADEPSKFTAEELTEMHVRQLEKQLIEAPENWLWSHKRWKYKYEDYHK